MIYLKYFNKNESKLHSSKKSLLLKKYGIVRDYNITRDGRIDVDDEVDVSYKCKGKLEINFGNVNGNFYCTYNDLTTLEGCPEYINNLFDCSYNDLKNLNNCPVTGGDIYCEYNQLTSLSGLPKELNGCLDIGDNKLTSLEHCPVKIKGYLGADNNNIDTFDFIPKECKYLYCFGNPIHPIYQLISNIVQLDYFNLVEFAENWNPVRKGRVIVLDRLNDYLENFGNPTVDENWVKSIGYKCF